jgi:hypothetical protein
MATAAQRASAARQRDAAEGLIQVNIRVPVEHAAMLHRAAMTLRQERPREVVVYMRDARGRLRPL